MPSCQPCFIFIDRLPVSNSDRFSRFLQHEQVHGWNINRELWSPVIQPMGLSDGSREPHLQFMRHLCCSWALYLTTARGLYNFVWQNIFSWSKFPAAQVYIAGGDSGQVTWQSFWMLFQRCLRNEIQSLEFWLSSWPPSWINNKHYQFNSAELKWL